jgi:hypothetical protein
VIGPRVTVTGDRTSTYRWNDLLETGRASIDVVFVPVSGSPLTTGTLAQFFRGDAIVHWLGG